MVYFKVFIMSIKESLHYRASFVIKVSMLFVFMGMFTVIWKNTTYNSTLSTNQILFYLLLSESFLLSRCNITNYISTDIKTGSLALKLNKPFNYPLYVLSYSYGAFIINFIAIFLSGIIFQYITLGEIFVNFTHFTYITPLLFIIGYLIDFVIQLLLSTYSFRFENVNGLTMIYNKLLLILGGIIFPIALLSDKVANIFEALPFASVIYIPAMQFINGRQEINSYSSVFLVALLWLTALSVLTYFAYNKTIKRININGG